MNSRSGTQARQGWTFVTNHLLVMKCIAEDPENRMIDIANRIGITDRGVQGIVNELVHAGYLVRERVGRRNHYRISTGMPCASSRPSICISGSSWTCFAAPRWKASTGPSRHPNWGLRITVP